MKIKVCYLNSSKNSNSEETNLYAHNFDNEISKITNKTIKISKTVKVVICLQK